MLFVICYLNHRQQGKGRKAEGREGEGKHTLGSPENPSQNRFEIAKTY